MKKRKTGQRRRRLRVLIAEDSALMRENLSNLLGGLPGLEVVGQAEDGRQAIRAAHTLKPDVLTLDIHLPELNGIEILRRLGPQPCRIVVLTAMSDDFYREKCRELRVEQFFDKITEFDAFMEFMGSM